MLIDVVDKQCTMTAPSITTHSNLKVVQPVHLAPCISGACQNQKEMVERTVFHEQKNSLQINVCMAIYNWLKSATLFCRTYLHCFVKSVFSMVIIYCWLASYVVDVVHNQEALRRGRGEGGGISF